MAEIEADDILERTVGGKRRKVEQGQKWIGLNRPPYGYKTVGRGREVSLLIDEETAQVVRDIFRWYVEGEDASGPLSTLRTYNKCAGYRTRWVRWSARQRGRARVSPLRPVLPAQ